MLDRLGGRRNAFGALDGVLHTLSRLPRGTTAPASPDADGLPGFPAAPTGEKLEPTHVEVPAAKQQEQQQQQHHQQQVQQVTSGTAAASMFAEAVVRGLVSRVEGFDTKGEAGETVGLGAAIAGHERVVVFLLSQGVYPVSMMNGAGLGGNVRLCTALLATLRPYIRIYTVGASGLLQAGQGAAAAEQQAAEVVAGGREGQAFRDAEQEAGQTLKGAANLCLRLICTAALPAPWPTDSHGSSCEDVYNSADIGGGSNADSCAGDAGSSTVGGPVGSRWTVAEARGGFTRYDGRLAAAGDGSRRHPRGSSSGGDGDGGGSGGGGGDGGGGGSGGGGGDGGGGSGSQMGGGGGGGDGGGGSGRQIGGGGGGGDGGGGSGRQIGGGGGGGDGGGGSGRQIGGASSNGMGYHMPSTDAILAMVSAARAAADAAAIAVLSTALQSDPLRAHDLTAAPAAAAAAAALAAQSRWGPCVAAAPAAPDCCAPSGSPRGLLSPAASPASSPSQPSTHWPHGSPGASPLHISHEPDGSSNSSSPHRPAASALSAVSAAAGATFATANRQYLILARSLVHAWGADPRVALSLAVWSGSGPLVSELLRAGADPRALRHGHASFGNAVTWGRWDIVEGMYGRGDVRTALFLVAMKGLLLLYSAAVHLDFRLRLVGKGVWGLAALGRMRVVRWAAAVAERAWGALWHALWWWMWG